MKLKLLTSSSEPLTGEDAERLVAYVENPVKPEGHAEFIKRADETYAEIKERPDTAS